MTLPPGAVVRLNPHTRVYDDGRTLVGGSPTRLLHLSDAARRLLRPWGLAFAPGPAEVLADRLLDLGLADPDLDSLPAVSLVELTVVVPVRDRADALDRLLEHLPPVREVIVVDDASTSPSAIAAVCARHRVTLARLPVNRGPAAARNAGLRHVRTSFVAFLDSDVVPEPSSLEWMLRHFHDSRVALVAPRIVGLSSTGSWVTRYENARSSLDLGPHPGVVRPRSRVSWVPSACLLARVVAVGDGFSEGMRVGEDVDLAWRLAAAGWRVRYEPTARVRHEHRVSIVAWLRRKAFYGTSAHDLAQRHGPAVAPAVVAPWSAVFVAALLAQRWWSLPVAFGSYWFATARLASELQAGAHPMKLAARLSARGASASLTQLSALLLRHWWPGALVAAMVSPRIRRAVVIAALLDGAIEWRRTGTDLDPGRFLVARRLDDLAYGAGVWWTSWRARSARALLPDIRRRGDRRSAN